MGTPGAGRGERNRTDGGPNYSTLSVMTRRLELLAPGVAAGLVVVAVGLLYAQGQLRFGATPDEMHGSGEVLAVQAALAALGTALAVKSARVPVAITTVAVTALVALGGITGTLNFYDAGGLGLALGIASLVALWLGLAGRRTRRAWSRDVTLRMLTYLTLGVVGVPAITFAGMGAACSGASEDDDLCGLGWVVLGLPALVILWLLVIGVAETMAARERRRSRQPGTAAMGRHH